MPKYIVEGSDLTSVANTIRTKGGTSGSLSFPNGWNSAIMDISGGADIPVFTATYDSNSTLESFVCNMTFAEVNTYFDNGNNISALLVEEDEDEETPGVYYSYKMPIALWYDDWESQSPNIVGTITTSEGFPSTVFTYYPNGTLSTPTDADVYEFPTLTTNGWHYPTQGKTFGGVNVSVTPPQPTLITKSITANGTYTASSDSADGYSSVTVNVSGGVEMFPVQIENATSSTFTAYYVNADGSAHTQYPFVPGTITVYVPSTNVYYKAQTPLIWFTKASSVSLSVSAKGFLCVSSDGTKCCIIPTGISTANTKITISYAT